MKGFLIILFYTSGLLTGCDSAPDENFEEKFPKSEVLLKFKANLQDPFEEYGDEVHGMEVKYNRDTINVKFKFNSGMANVNQAIGFKSDTLMLYYHLWCEICVTEWMGYELEYKILNKSRKRYKLKPIRISSGDLKKN